MKRYTRFFILFFVFAFFVLLFVSYRLHVKDNKQNYEAAHGKKIEKVAYIIGTYGVDDEAFCQNGWTGVREFCKKYKIDCQYYMALSDAVAETVNSIDLAVADGATIVAVPSCQFVYALGEAHRKYPSVKFIGIDMEPVEKVGKLGKNAFLYTFHEEEVGYLAGYATVAEGYTHLGYIGGMAVPPVIRYGYGFLIGADDAARKLNKRISINYCYAGQFFGDANITAKMDGWYTNGTQVVFAGGGTLYTSVLESAAPYMGMMIGIDVDQHSLGIGKANYDPILTSAMKNITASIEDFLSMAIDGRWDEIAGKHKVISMRDGDYFGLPTSKESWQFKHFTRSEYNELLKKMHNGEIVVHTDVNHIPNLTNTKLRMMK